MKSRLIILVLTFLSWLPLRWQRRLGSFLGSWAFLAGTRMARTTEINLGLCFPELSEAERRQLARASLRHTFQTICEAGGVWLWPAGRILACIERVEGLELLRAALAQGKGVVVAGPHLGNWELLGLYLSAAGLGPSRQLFQPPGDPRLGKLIYDARSRGGAHMVPTDKQGVALLLRALKAGEIVGILPDQVPPMESGEFAPFFGKPALTMTLLTRLQQKTGARVLCGAAWRSEGGFVIEFSEPDPAIYAADPQAALWGLNASVEVMARKNPEQYQWEYKRFKRQPPGLSAPY
ncbi:MAG: lysophospholipid acyltransferase family protein [Pseudomonadales bacterium]|jgi:KDO2-lipid IV(A) lauroyltransferase|nr:lysophospholipid acyltransferase family protein [Pseudomonadales bacterium]